MIDPQQFELVVVGGSRHYPDRTQVEDVLEAIRIPVTIYVSGGAPGVDTWVETLCKRRQWPFLRFPAEWDRLGKRAGRARNHRMAEVADAVVVFWDGKSPGTRNMIGHAHDYDLPLRVWRPYGPDASAWRGDWRGDWR